jgi:single-strand DNA-binding protein
MAGINCVFLLGRLTRDPELRLTSHDTAVARFGLAVARRSRDATGELQEVPVFVEVVAFGPTASPVGAHLRKGRAVVLEGRLELDRWETEAGERRERLQVVAQRVTFLPRTIGAQPKDEETAVAVPAWIDQEG